MIAVSEIVSLEVPGTQSVTQPAIGAPTAAATAASPEPTLAEKTGDAVAGAILKANDALQPITKAGGVLHQIEDALEDAAESVTDTFQQVSDNVRAVAQVASDRLAQGPTATSDANSSHTKQEEE